MLRTAIVAVLSLCCSAAANAGVVFDLGNNPQPNEENILLNSGVSGTTVFGETNQTGLVTQFSSITDILNEPSSGAARVAADDGLVNDVTISIPNGFFTDFIGNPFNGAGTATVTVIANEPGGGTSTFMFSYSLGNGSNFVTITTTGGETIASLTFDAPDGFSDLRQPRISGAALTAVPEPGTMTMMLIGCAAIALCGRRRWLSKPCERR